MRKWGGVVVLMGAVLGLLAGGLALQGYLAVQAGGLAVPSFCNINDTLNCDLVTASSYAAVAGIPVAVVGLLFFALQLIYGLWVVIRREAAQGVVAVGLALAVLGVLPSAYLLYVMHSILQTYCLTCLAMDAALLLVVGGWLAAGGLRSPSGSRPARLVAPSVVMVLVFGAGIGLVFAKSVSVLGGKRPSPQLIAEAVRAFQAQPAQSLVLAPEHPSWGATDAKVTIVEFSDFQCPFCARAAFQIKPYLTEFRRAVRLVFVNYPLDQSCNAQLQHPMHPFACLAARAVLCAHADGGFWGLHDAIFRNQARINRDLLVELAVGQGLDRERFVQCLDAPETAALVQRDLALGQQAQINATPTVLINGRPLRHWTVPALLRAVIRTELQAR